MRADVAGSRPTGVAALWHDRRVGVEVREARPDEFGAIGDLTVEAYAALLGADHLSDYRAELEDVAGRASSATVLVAVEGGAVLGSVTYVPGPQSPLHEFEDPEAASIRMLAVAPAAQGRGIGHELTAACIALARSAERRRVVLYSTEPMVVARAMYERMGFVRDEGRDWTFTREDGSTLVLLCYELELRADDAG